ncbi:hypothetical protein OM076_08960 [Solirubrobacter ginsenosidimutans]|uniref:Uncharacterized protein n=1 Tax=Solirubrobacter ginsenosidimutans TaxID=490573 RepID=A0A9X3S4A7_9ACTN|nr:hypothetical protein [Solirubrobacter ginsenosidimutans]MDA0160393.1 hypothetical protein [Solirubrobacter ginsenosidimutans]
MPSRTGAAVICAALLLFALHGVLGTTADAASTVNAGLSGGLSDSEIMRIGMGFAAANGDPDPDDVTAIATTHNAAVHAAMAGDDVGDDEDVDLIVMTGDFAAEGAKHPPGAEIPTGTFLSLVIEPRTGEIWDYGLDSRRPDLSSLGDPTSLSRR